MNFRKTILPNGLRVITVPMQDNKTVTAMVLVEAGSRYENEKNNGISHFLEHMCFKGTLKRPTSLEISTEFEKIGSSYNAFTSEVYTGFYAKAAAEKGQTILEMISDLYLNSTLPETEIEKEKGVVIEEINMYLDRPESLVWHAFEELAYGGSPLGRKIIGSKETVASFSREDLENYRKSHYVPAKTLLLVAGAFDQGQIMEKVEETFGHIAVAPVINLENIIEVQKKPQIKIQDKATDQSHLVLGFRSFGYFDPRLYPAALLTTIFGHGMSSRLFHRLREELGLCYYIGAGHNTYHDLGMFTINAGVSNDKVGQAIKEIMNVINNFLKSGPADEEIQKAKDYKIGHLYLGLETSDQMADWYGFQEIYHEEILTPEEHVAKIKAVTKEEIISVAKDIFEISKANLAVIGPHQGKEASFLSLIC